MKKPLITVEEIASILRQLSEATTSMERAQASVYMHLSAIAKYYRCLGYIGLETEIEMQQEKIDSLLTRIERKASNVYRQDVERFELYENKKH